MEKPWKPYENQRDGFRASPGRLQDCNPTVPVNRIRRSMTGANFPGAGGERGKIGTKIAFYMNRCHFSLETACLLTFLKS